MKAFNTSLHRFLFSSAIGFISLTASSVYAQTSATAQSGDEGLFSYIFSFRAVTVILVMMLAAQIMYRHRRRNPHKLEIVHNNPHGQLQRKKRYDSAQMSSLLKATASGTSNPVLLAQPADLMTARNAHQSSVLPPESQPVPATPDHVAVEEDESSTEAAADSSAAESPGLPTHES